MLLFFFGYAEFVVQTAPIRTLTLSDWDASLSLETQSATLRLWTKSASLTVDNDQ